MFEKSGGLLSAQYQLVQLRKARERRNVGWFLRLAASYRARDMRHPDCFEVEWEHPASHRTRYVNG